MYYKYVLVKKKEVGRIMRLAELLYDRKIIKEEIKRIKERLNLSAKVQEGDTVPVESPEELKAILINLFGRLEELITKINNSNVKCRIEGKNLMELIAERDRYSGIAKALHELAEGATPKSERFSRKEIRYVPVVNIKEIRREADDYAGKARAIDAIIQVTNWDTEV